MYRYETHLHTLPVSRCARAELENQMAHIYAQAYNLITFTGTDNHLGAGQKILAGVGCSVPVTGEKDFVRKVMAGEMKVFSLKR